MSNQENESIIINKEQCSDLIKKIIPFTKSLNIYEKKVAYDFNILIECFINKTNSATMTYLHDGIKHVIEFYSSEINNLLNNKINRYDIKHEALHDIATGVLHQVLFTSNLEKFNKLLLDL